MTIIPKNRSVISQRGFSLVEVLIALVVMSVGMLGIAGLYIQGMQAGRTSMFRHHAITLAGDIADRIRANPTALADYAASAGADHGCIAGTINCTPTQMADTDVEQWTEQVEDALPEGAVTITVDNAANPPTAQIAVTWSEPGQAQAPTYTITIPVLPL